MDRHSRIYWYRPYLRDTRPRIVRPNNMPAAARPLRRRRRRWHTVHLAWPRVYLRLVRFERSPRARIFFPSSPPAWSLMPFIAILSDLVSLIALLLTARLVRFVNLSESRATRTLSAGGVRRCLDGGGLIKWRESVELACE